MSPAVPRSPADQLLIDGLEAQVAHLQSVLDGLTPHDDVVVLKCLGFTKFEARILCCLWRRAGHVLSKEAIQAAMYVDRVDGGADPKIVDVMVCKLRAKLRDRGAPELPETVWACGYRVNPALAAWLECLVGPFRPAVGPAR